MQNETFRGTVIGSTGSGVNAILFDFGFRDNTGGSVHIDTGTAAGDFQTLVQSVLAAVLPSTYTFVRYRFACVGGDHVGEIGFVEVSPPVNGDNSVFDYILPNEIAISLKRATGYSSRHDRGRVFLGPVGSYLASASSNKPDAANTDLIAAANLVKAVLTTGGVALTPVILSSAGTTNGRTIIHASIGQVYVHRRSRRPRVLV